MKRLTSTRYIKLNNERYTQTFVEGTACTVYDDNARKYTAQSIAESVQKRIEAILADNPNDELEVTVIFDEMFQE